MKPLVAACAMALAIALHAGAAEAAIPTDTPLGQVPSGAVPALVVTPSEAASGPPALRPLVPAPADIAARPPYLRGVLPQDALGYIRVPSVWGLIAAPKGNVFDKALRSAPYAETMENLRAGVLDTLVPELPREQQFFWQLLLGRIRSPLEVVVLPAAATAKIPVEVVATAAVDSDDPRAITTLLHEITERIPDSALLAPLGADGSGLLAVAGMPIQIYFAADQKRLYLRFTDPGADTGSLAQWATGLQPTDSHPMYAAEQAIDSGGQGIFLWVSPAPLLQALEKMGKARPIAMLRAFALSEAKSLALGVGSSAGKERIKVLLDMPQVGLRSFLPTIDNELTLKTAGAPGTLALLGLPDPGDLATLEGVLGAMMSPEDMRGYQAAKTQLQEALGFSLEQLLGAFGDELIAVSDKAGRYLALRVRDPAAYRQIVQQLVQRFQLRYEQRTVQGHLYHHLVVPALALAQAQAPDQEAELPAWAKRLEQLPSHVYWTEEGDYVLISGLPQTLMDYRHIADKVAVSDWLKQSQGVNAKGALLLGTTRTDGVPRWMYEIDLWLMAALGDLVERPVDLFAFPTPRELGLPASGAYSFQLSSSPQQLALELVYESNPLELLLGIGGMQAIAMTGVVAAIAIPAYHDYTVKAQMSGAMAQLHQLQAEIQAFVQEHNRYPSGDEAQAMVSNVAAPGIQQIEVEADTGTIYVMFDIPGLGEERELLLVPTLENGEITWQCQGNLDAKHIPETLCHH